jgi:hypothetical protein
MEVTVCTQYPPVHMIRTDTPEKYGRFSHYNCRWEMLDHKWSPLLTSETPDRILFRPVCQLSDYFSSIGQKDTAHRLSKRERFSASAIGWHTYMYRLLCGSKITSNRKVRQTCSIFHFDATYWYIKQPFVLSRSFWMLQSTLGVRCLCTMPREL